MKIEFVTLSESGTQFKRHNPFPTSTLLWPTLAALTPEDIEITIQDQHYTPLSLNTDADLVGITVSTPVATASYQFGKELARRGKTVVYGGPHITQIQGYDFANEPFVHGGATSVFVGDAESTWPQFLADVRAGRTPQQVYAGGRFDFQTRISPRREIIKRIGWQRCFPQIVSIESSRGCPGTCAFCCSNGECKMKPMKDVKHEMAETGKRRFSFVDSNIGPTQKRLDDLLEALTGRGYSWVGSAYLPVLKGKGKKMRKAGCGVVYIGFESVIHESAVEARKPYVKIETCKEIIREMHDNGIAVIGSFVFGFDHDDQSVFEKTLEFGIEAQLNEASFHILTPFPGTAIFDRLLAEGRLKCTNFPHDWGKYRRGNVVYEPTLMTPEELEAGYRWILKEFYSLRSIRRRLNGQMFGAKNAGMLFANILKGFGRF